MPTCSSINPARSEACLAMGVGGFKHTKLEDPNFPHKLTSQLQSLKIKVPRRKPSFMMSTLVDASGSMSGHVSGVNPKLAALCKTLGLDHTTFGICAAAMIQMREFVFFENSSAYQLNGAFDHAPRYDSAGICPYVEYPKLTPKFTGGGTDISSALIQTCQLLNKTNKVLGPLAPERQLIVLFTDGGALFNHLDQTQIALVDYLLRTGTEVIMVVPGDNADFMKYANWKDYNARCRRPCEAACFYYCMGLNNIIQYSKDTEIPDVLSLVGLAISRWIGGAPLVIPHFVPKT